jgi:hypothetical protein
MMPRAPEEVIRMMEKPLPVSDEATRAESAARLEAWAGQLARLTHSALAAPLPAAAADEGAAREERKRTATTLLAQLDALNARPNQFDEDSLCPIFIMVLEERALRRRLSGK